MKNDLKICPLRSYLVLLQTSKKTLVFCLTFQLIPSLINKISKPSINTKSFRKANKLQRNAYRWLSKNWKIMLQNRKCWYLSFYKYPERPV